MPVSLPSSEAIEASRTRTHHVQTIEVLTGRGTHWPTQGLVRSVCVCVVRGKLKFSFVFQGGWRSDEATFPAI